MGDAVTTLHWTVGQSVLVQRVSRSDRQCFYGTIERVNDRRVRVLVRYPDGDRTVAFDPSGISVPGARELAAIRDFGNHERSLLEHDRARAKLWDARKRANVLANDWNIHARLERASTQQIEETTKAIVAAVEAYGRMGAP